MKFNFIWDLNTETERILHASMQIANGFYANNRFLVLPYLDYKNPSCIYFPNLGYDKMGDYWKLASKIPQQLPIRSDKKIFEFVNKILIEKFQTNSKTLIINSNKNSKNNIETESFSINKNLLTEFEEKWQVVQKDFIRFATELFPDTLKTIDQVEVRLTNFGSIGSWNILGENNNKSVCYIRKDADISHLAESILTQLFYKHMFEYQMSWEGIESTVDYLISKSILSTLFQSYKPTMQGIKLASNKTKLDSEKYIETLEVPNYQAKLKTINDKFYINEKNIDNKLTKNEHKILKLLIKNTQEIVTIDKIAETIWTYDEDKFSLWAINKQMQRLRKKLTDNGMPLNCITVVRGRGYILK